MEGLKFSEEEKDGIFRVISAIMFLCKIEIRGGKKDGTSEIDLTQNSVKRCAEMLGLEEPKLNEVLCQKFIVVAGKRIQKDVDVEEAAYNRETFSKFLYSSLFNWIVDRVNVAIRKPFEGGKKKYRSIGILDIFGFEIFETNSFEQLCINYTNEKLQQHFNSHMFKMEQQEYTKEKIDWSSITFVDNADTIDLIEGKVSIFKCVDDGCKMNKTDPRLLNDIKSQLKSHKPLLEGSKLK